MSKLTSQILPEEAFAKSYQEPVSASDELFLHGMTEEDLLPDVPDYCCNQEYYGMNCPVCGK